MKFLIAIFLCTLSCSLQAIEAVQDMYRFEQQLQLLQNASKVANYIQYIAALRATFDQEEKAFSEKLKDISSFKEKVEKAKEEVFFIDRGIDDTLSGVASLVIDFHSLAFYKRKLFEEFLGGSASKNLTELRTQHKLAKKNLERLNVEKSAGAPPEWSSIFQDQIDQFTTIVRFLDSLIQAKEKLVNAEKAYKDTFEALEKEFYKNSEIVINMMRQVKNMWDALTDHEKGQVPTVYKYEILKTDYEPRVITVGKRLDEAGKEFTATLSS